MLEWLLLAAAAGCALLVGVGMARRPILARMAARNAVRRPRQSLTVVAGLLVGTAIVSASLVAGGSAAYAIRGYVYQSLGHADASVSIQGYPYFPESAADHLADDPALQGSTDGITSLAVWSVSASSSTGLFEPRSALVGFDTRTTEGFGEFSLWPSGVTDGSRLAPGTALVTKRLADELAVGPGDVVELTYTIPFDPVRPTLTFLNGTLDHPTLPGVPPLAGTTADVFEVTVPEGATRFVAAALFRPGATPPVSSPTLAATEPSGTMHEAPEPQNATTPTVLDLRSTDGTPLAAGTWTVQVGGTAVAQPYTGIAVVAVPTYTLQGASNEIGRLRDPPDLGALEDILRRFLDLEPRTATVTVAGITDGGRGDLFDFREAIFAPLPDVQAMLGREGEVNLVLVSNPGGREAGARGTQPTMRNLNASLEALAAGTPGSAVHEALEARPLKQEFLQVADDAGEFLTGLLLFAGSLSVITGLLLIVNIFTMLAEERRSELGMARAIGLSRRDLVRLFTYEGAIYAVAAAAAGALLGVALAYGLVEFLNVLVGRLAAERTFPPIPFRPRLGDVVLAFSIGALLTFSTMAVASRRTSRLNVVRAIRRIPEPEVNAARPQDLAFGSVLLAAGGAASLAGWQPALALAIGLGQHPMSLQVFGPLLAAVGLGLLLRAWVRRHVLLPLLAGALAAVYAASMFASGKLEEVEEANVVGPIRGVLLTFCVVVLAVHFEPGARAGGWLLARVGALRAIALPAVAYPLHRKLRTGMTVAMFAVVLLSIGFFSIFGALFETDPERQTGGFEVAGRTTLDVVDLEDHDLGLVEDGLVVEQHRLDDFETEEPGFITVAGERTGNYGEVGHHVYGYDEAFAARGGFSLLWRGDAYATDRQAYEAVLSEPDLVIVSYTYSTNARNQDLAFEVGDTLELHLGDETVPLRIAGIQEQYHYGGIFLPRDRVAALFTDTRGFHLFDLRSGADSSEAALLLESNYRSAGLDAEDTQKEVLDQQESFRQVLGAMKLYLGLGLVVGVLSLGIVTSRNVLERRQEIGMLRALGCTRGSIRALFFLEVTATILVGAVVGLACAVLVTFSLWYSLVRDLGYPYLIPWAEIGTLVLVSYLVAILAAMAPIGRSAKVAPAEALRYVE